MSTEHTNHQNSCTQSLTDLVQSRHTVRAFTSQPVNQSLLEECLYLAQTSPSNSNLQPWRITVLTNASLTRISSALLAAVKSGQKPTTSPIPASHTHHRSAMGHALYGPQGYNIPREDTSRAEAARCRNYSFFGAPMALIVSMDSSLAEVDVLSVGMYLQTLCLLLAERGVASSYQVSVVGYPDVLKRELGMAEEIQLLCGVAIGYEDREAQINKLRIDRDDWRENVFFVQD